MSRQGLLRVLGVAVVVAVGVLGFLTGSGLGSLPVPRAVAAGPLGPVVAVGALAAAGAGVAALLAGTSRTGRRPRGSRAPADPQTVAVHPASGESAEYVLRMSAALAAAAQNEPLLRALARAGQRRLGPLPLPAEVEERAGLGIQGLVAELVELPGLPVPTRPARGAEPVTPLGGTARIVAHAVLVGSPALLAEYGIALPESLTGPCADSAAVAVAWDGRARGVVLVDAGPRPGGGAVSP